ncbi:hypothetical protein, conserved [Trypanosoma brucei gambiense DAL972]|uniref:Glycosyltransferase (GlcNAc) n=1 Tax=Trypanosoma brucei gambiense (strain MHOM/CI/86/DAL972) TaxID=679716 RepID=C9ZJ13_TRYB9|nr:hypothetical protein, conserved [Trypanosoma brucei gambiense DAL972]CBH09371.1 hypothetical protein, conserved [Trypanosoma brucei gambiense DAL972]|eukprot:XP_011771677.1 hypothetical protein, conserved [Trypanosoma brucei gambiense DAL972]
MHYASRGAKRQNQLRLPPAQKPGRLRVLARSFRGVNDAVGDFTQRNNESPLLYALLFVVGLLILLFIVLFVVLLCILLRSDGWSTIDAFSSKTHIVEDPDKSALLEIRRLYDTMMRTGSDREATALLEFLSTYQRSMEARVSKSTHGDDENAGDNGNVGDSGVPQGKSKYASEKPRVSNGTSLSQRSFAEVLADVRETIQDIMTLDPDVGLDRAAFFVKEKFGASNDDRSQRTDSTGSHDIERGEVEAFEPFDDILYLQLLSFFAKEEPTRSISSADRLWWRRKRISAPSVMEGRFYYPLRRFHRMQSFSPDTISTVAAWFDTMALDYYGEEMEPFESSLQQSYEGAQVSNHSGSSPENPEIKEHAVSFSPSHTASIFVSVASFRDVECQSTLQQVVHRATNMFRTYVGIAEQHNKSDPPCLSYDLFQPTLCPSAAIASDTASARAVFSDVLCFPMDNIRLRHIAPDAARGPTYGRYMTMLLYRGEDYVLILDSHTRFVYGWDSRVVAMHMYLRHPRIVLSHYPEGFEKELSNFTYERTTTVYLCRASFIESDGYVRLGGILVNEENVNKFSHQGRVLRYAAKGFGRKPDADVSRPLPQPWAAGGFLFARGSIMREVPLDPHLPNTFDGEEVLYSVRLWTHGYDIHSPNRTICYHVYTRNDQPKVWNNNPLWSSLRLRSRERIQCLLQTREKGQTVPKVPVNTTDPAVTIDVDRYGMGRVRTVENWYRFAGLDPVRYTFDGRWCGKGKI